MAAMECCRGTPPSLIRCVEPPAAGTTPARTDELVVPGCGYLYLNVVGYSASVSLMSVYSPTPDWSNCQYAIDCPSGLQRKQFRRSSSSSFTQSEVPLMMSADPSLVSCVIFSLA